MKVTLRFVDTPLGTLSVANVELGSGALGEALHHAVHILVASGRIPSCAGISSVQQSGGPVSSSTPVSKLGVVSVLTLTCVWTERDPIAWLRANLARQAVSLGPSPSASPGRVYYCQNPNQSGDSNGVGYALVLHPGHRLLFFFNHDEVRVALSFLRFYADLGIARDRLIAVVCDVDDKRRPDLPSEKQRPLLAEAMTVWAQHNPLLEFVRKKKRVAPVKLAPPAKATLPVVGPERPPVDKIDTLGGVTRRPPTRREKGQLSQREAAMDSLLGPTLLAEWGRRSREFLAEPTEVSRGTAEHRELHAVATVVPWRGKTLSGNQLYQCAADPDRTRWAENEIASQLGFEAHDRLYNIGQTTEDVMASTRRYGTRTIGAMRAVFRGPIAAIDRFADEFLQRIVSGPGRPILVLVWIRGVSGAERDKLREARLTGDDISEANFARINTPKRNPHHVMTAQLYDSICRTVDELSRTTGRWYHVCPIGDEIHLNQYDPTSPKHLAASEDNLVNFFRRLPEFAYKLGKVGIGARRFHQSYFLHRLATDRRLAGVEQIGLRSGAMETLMYLGFPTIYIEDQFEESGPRMAAVTSEGGRQAATDVAFLRQHAAAKGNAVALERLRAQREASQVALLPAPLNEVFAGRVEMEKVLAAAAEGIQSVHRQREEPAPPFPFFFRLLTRNLIGLNPIGRGHVERLSFFFGGSVRQARGSLTDHELALLKSLIAYAGESMAAYQAAIARGEPLARPESYIYGSFKPRGSSTFMPASRSAPPPRRPQPPVAHVPLLSPANVGKVARVPIGVPRDIRLIEAAVLQEATRAAELARQRKTTQAPVKAAASGKAAAGGKAEVAVAVARQKLSEGDHFYVTEEICMLQRAALAGHANVAVLGAMRRADLDATRPESYDPAPDDPNRRYITAHTDTIIRPLHVRGEHWGLLYIRLGAAGADRRRAARVLYIDPLHPEGVPDLTPLARAFHPLTAESCTVQYQDDEFGVRDGTGQHSCGAWNVMLAVHLVHNGDALPARAANPRTAAVALRAAQERELARLLALPPAEGM